MKTAIFTKPLTVMLSPGDYDRIKQITDDQQISMAQWVRQAVEMALKNQGEPLQ